LLIDHRPRRKVAGQIAPGRAGMGQIEERIQNAAQ
jgi:hypothetical protein